MRTANRQSKALRAIILSSGIFPKSETNGGDDSVTSDSKWYTAIAPFAPAKSGGTIVAVFPRDRNSTIIIFIGESHILTFNAVNAYRTIGRIEFKCFRVTYLKIRVNKRIFLTA